MDITQEKYWVLKTDSGWYFGSNASGMTFENGFYETQEEAEAAGALHVEEFTR